MSMGLLDRFKPQPRWKHADPAVRAAGVQELPEDEQDLLAEIARTDPDARVRRVAVSKLGSVAVLGEIVRSERDAEVRDEAAGVLLDIALGAYEADEAASLAAVEGLTGLPPAEGLKQLVLVAKTARREAVSRRALDRLGGEARALGTTARRAEQPAIRLEALARLDDPQEISATALRSDHKDVALAALERVAERQALAVIAARARNPAAQRRARAMLRTLEEREAAAAEAEARRLAALENRRRAERDLCREVEALVAPADWEQAPRRLASAEARWAELGADAEPDLSRRFGEAVAAAREALRRHDAERAEQERLARQREADAAARMTLGDRVAAVPPREVSAVLPSLRAEWEALPPMTGGDDPALIARFEAACRRAETRAREADMVDETIGRLEALCAEAEGLAADAAAATSADGRARARRLREQWRAALPAVEGDTRVPALAERWERSGEQLRAREQEAREAKAGEERQLVGRAEHAASAAERLALVTDATLKALDRALREAREALAALDRVLPSSERDAIVPRLERAIATLVPRAQEMREAEDWQRWANASVQEQLIAKMEALRAVDDPASAARQMRELQGEWKKVAAGPREQGQALWRRFKAASDEVRARTDAWFSEQAQHRAENLQKKLALCERAEALADSTDWIATAEAIKALQAEWKGIGPGPRKEEQAAWDRFRTACDRFFRRRHDDLAQRKHAWAENLARKEALCVRAEALADSTDWEAASAEVKRLQAEWKTIGPVRKNKSEQIWQRFRAACDHFFERYKQRHILDLTSRVSAREAIIREAEELARAVAPSGDAPPAELDPVSTVRGLRSRWAEAPALPRDVVAPLVPRFEAALAAIVGTAPEAVRGTEFDVSQNVRRLEDLVARAEKLAGPEPASREPATPATILAAQLREALAANTIGGRADDESKWRAAEHELRHLQSAWTTVGFVPEAQARPLVQRFQRACQRFFDQREQRRRALAGSKS